LEIAGKNFARLSAERKRDPELPPEEEQENMAASTRVLVSGKYLKEMAGFVRFVVLKHPST
jgi:hypothetical protein